MMKHNKNGTEHLRPWLDSKLLCANERGYSMTWK